MGPMGSFSVLGNVFFVTVLVHRQYLILCFLYPNVLFHIPTK